MPASRHRFEWLRDYLEYDDEIRYLRWRIRKAKLEEERWAGGDLANIRLECGSHGAHVMDKVPGLEKELTYNERQQKELLELVDTFDGCDNDILKLKYIDGLTLEEISDELPYSYDWVKRRHAELHRRLNFLDEYEQRRYEFENRLDSGVRIIPHEFE